MTTTSIPPTDNIKFPDPAPHKKRRWLKIFLGLVALLLILLLLTPTLLSTGPGRSFILNQINSRIPGKIRASGLSIGWFSSTSVEGFELRDPDGKTVLSWNQATTGLSILGYLTHSGYDFGAISLTNIRGDIITYPDGTTNLYRVFIVRTTPAASGPAASSPAPSAPPPPPSAAASPAPAPSPPLNLNADINAQIEHLTFTAPNAPQLSIDNSTIKVRTAPDTIDADVTINLRSGQGAPAKITVTAKVADLRADHPTGTGRAQIAGLDLAALTPLLNAIGIQLTPAGKFTSDLAFASTADAATLKGTPAITQFTLSGAAFNGDTLRSASVKFPLDVKFSKGMVTLTNSGLQSDLLSLNLSGTANLGDAHASNAAVPDFDLTGTVDYDLARLAAALPHTLPEKLTMEGRRSVPLHIKGPLTAEDGLRKFLKLQINVTPGWDRISYSGVDLGKADLPLSLDGGILTITPTDLPANGGTLHAQGAVDLNGPAPVYILKNAGSPHSIVSNLALNQQIAGGPLRFLPLIWGAGDKDINVITVTGSANLDIDEAYLPADMPALKSKGTLTAIININKLHTEAPIISQLTSAVGGLAKLAGLSKTASMDGDIKNISVILKDGKFNYENFRLGNSVANIAFSGTVGLDDSLAMNVQIGAAGLSIPIPIALGGTISSPRPTISDQFTKNLGKDFGKDLKGVGQDVKSIGKDIGQGLGDLFKKK